MERKETRKMFDQTPYHLKETYSTLLDPESKSIKDEVMSIYGEEVEGKRTLDAGCGSGLYLVKLLYCGSNAFGLDLSLNSLKTINRMLKEFNWPTPPLINADVENLAFRNELFDIISCWGVLHHTDNPIKGLAELARVMKKEGGLYLTLYHKRNIWAYLKSLLRFLCKRSRITASILKWFSFSLFRDHTIYNDNFVNPIVCTYTQKEFEKMCELVGLRLEIVKIFELPLLLIVPRKLRRHLLPLLSSYARRYGFCLWVKLRRMDSVNVYVKTYQKKKPVH